MKSRHIIIALPIYYKLKWKALNILYIYSVYVMLNINIFCNITYWAKRGPSFVKFG